MVSIGAIRRHTGKVLAVSTAAIVLPALYYCIIWRNSQSSYLAPMHQARPQEDLAWWEADDCQCNTEECLEPSVTFNGLLKGEVSETCGRRAWNASSKVLSLSLYGSDAGYWQGLEEIILQVEKLYPGWNVRVYTDPRHNAAVLCPLLHRYSSLLYVCDITSLPHPLGDLSKLHPMLWRVAPLGDSRVTAMLVRDSDSPVTRREVAAVEEWLASGKMFHVMRDHPMHDVPVLGGMWGARWDINPAFAFKLRTLRRKIMQMAVGKRNRGLDQDILKKVLWPTMTVSLVAHDSYNCKIFKGSSPWPTQRLEGSFVGWPRYRESRNRTDVKPCPAACRPPDHQDWEYC